MFFPTQIGFGPQKVVKFGHIETLVTWVQVHRQCISMWHWLNSKTLTKVITYNIFSFGCEKYIAAWSMEPTMCFFNQFSWIRGIKKNWGCNLSSVDPSLRRELSEVSPWNSWKEKSSTQRFITDQTCKKTFERYEIRCSRCCTSPFIDSTQNDQTAENVKPNINAKFFKPTHPSQRCQKRTLRRVPHFDTTRTPPLFSMYQTLSNIHSSGSVELFEQTVDIRFFQKTPTFQKTSEVHSESCHQQKHPVWPTWFSPVSAPGWVSEVARQELWWWTIHDLLR